MPFVAVHWGKARADDIVDRCVIERCMKEKREAAESRRRGATMEEERRRSRGGRRRQSGDEIDREDDGDGGGDSDGDDDESSDEDEVFMNGVWRGRFAKRRGEEDEFWKYGGAHARRRRRRGRELTGTPEQGVAGAEERADNGSGGLHQRRSIGGRNNDNGGKEQPRRQQQRASVITEDNEELGQKSWSSSKDTSIVIAACQQWCSPRGRLQIQDDDFIDARNTRCGCEYFYWLDPEMTDRATIVINGLLRKLDRMESEKRLQDEFIGRRKLNALCALHVGYACLALGYSSGQGPPGSAPALKGIMTISLECLPTDIIITILAKVGEKSLRNFFNVATTSKTIRFLSSEADKIYQTIELGNVALITKSSHTSFSNFFDKCYGLNNPQAIFSQGMKELHRATIIGHGPSAYIHGMLLMAQSINTIEAGIQYLDTHLLHRLRWHYRGLNDLYRIRNACQFLLRYRFGNNGLLPQRLYFNDVIWKTIIIELHYIWITHCFLDTLVLAVFGRLNFSNSS
ncbi:hypothetical protein Syun_012896 [Stephania yunnanensis]|uniref:F-box domain-containing protein n=1 Tax=Stephania yunnanensis TaxID=152371 RepID=A0AAP0K0C8_9MAGN